jgi:hypothetical protein
MKPLQYCRHNSITASEVSQLGTIPAAATAARLLSEESFGEGNNSSLEEEAIQAVRRVRERERKKFPTKERLLIFN